MEDVMAEMEVDKHQNISNEGSQLRKRNNLSQSPLLVDVEELMAELIRKKMKLLESFKNYRTLNLRMRDCYKYAVENDRVTCFDHYLIEEWYFWKMSDAILHIELEEHLSSYGLITHESSVNLVMEKLDMNSAELKKFDKLPKELIQSCVVRRIAHKIWLYRKSTMKDHILKTVNLYSSEATEPSEYLFKYLYNRNPFTGLELCKPSPPPSFSLLGWMTGMSFPSARETNIEISRVVSTCINLNEEEKLQNVEDYCEGYFEKFKSYLQLAWMPSLYTYMHKEVTRQKQNMDISFEDSEVKGTFDDAEWIHKEIQMVIEQYDKDEDEKDPKNIISDAVSRLESLLQEGFAHLSNKATKSSHCATPPSHRNVGLPKDFIERLSIAISEIKLVINIIDEKIESLTLFAEVILSLCLLCLWFCNLTCNHYIIATWITHLCHLIIE